MKLVYSLQAAGASVITVHGRTKEEKGHHVKECNWDIDHELMVDAKIIGYVEHDPDFDYEVLHWQGRK